MSDWITVSESSADAWDKKAPIQGVYIRKKENIGSNNSTMYILKTSKGEMGVWSSTVLDSRFEQIELGNEVRIEPLGEKKSEKSNRTYQDYKVEYRPAPFVEAGSDSSPLPGSTVRSATTVVDDNLPPVETLEEPSEISLKDIPF